MAQRLSVEIWSDVVCPWCYVGKRRFEKALTGFAHRAEVDVTWRSFELQPEAPLSYAGQGSYAQRLARKYGSSEREAQTMIDRMTVSAAAEGLSFDFAIAQPGRTFDAHRLLHLAGERGLQEGLKERLLRACFTEGQAIADRETLVRLAQDSGLDAEESRSVLGGEAYVDEVRADEARARALGITGVPFFLFEGRLGVSGAQPPDVLRSALERAWVESRVAGGEPRAAH